ncbi:hypothetical protein R50072_34360 [Simiduia litorea]|uniref:cupin domain-containing protein n=1 Tax=Simiduia litorea TaxID=1435348 RepID=UPI0036F2A99F
MNQHIRIKNAGNASRLTTNQAPSFSALDIDGWGGLILDDAGLTLFIFDISADAKEFPVHASEHAWLAYVIAGAGTLYAGNTDNQPLEALDYQAGDLMTFEAHTPHAWKNNGSPGKILFTRKN